MKLYHLIINAEPVLDTFSPVAIVEMIAQRCKGNGEIPVDIYTTEVV